jgi:signal transduction histidine kinase
MAHFPDVEASNEGNTAAPDLRKSEEQPGSQGSASAGFPATLGWQTVDALTRMGQAVTSSLDLDEVLERVLLQVSGLLGAEGVAILLPEGEELVFAASSGPGAERLQGHRMPLTEGVAGYVMRTGAGIWKGSNTPEYPAVDIYRAVEEVGRFHTQALLAAPLTLKGQTIGVLEAAHSRPDAFSPSDKQALEAAASWAAIAIGNAQLHRQAQEERELRTLIEERSRLVRDLHDAVVQALYSQTLLAAGWQRQIRAGQLTPQVEHVEELGQMAQQALKELRLLLFELRPAVLGQVSLLEALQQRLEAVEKRAGVSTTLHIVPHGKKQPVAISSFTDLSTLPTVASRELPADVQEGMYRIAQEALNNALKHSAATQVDICLFFGSNCISMEIRDNGVGFVAREVGAQEGNDYFLVNGGFGMESMRQRAEMIGGKLLIVSAPGKGTSVKVLDVPISSTGNGRDSR